MYTVRSSVKELRPKMSRRRIAGHSCVFFAYTPVKDVRCKFSLLCECRDDAQEYFREHIRGLGMRPKEIEIDARPWMITVLEPIDT